MDDERGSSQSIDDKHISVRQVEIYRGGPIGTASVQPLTGNLAHNHAGLWSGLSLVILCRRRLDTRDDVRAQYGTFISRHKSRRIDFRSISAHCERAWRIGEKVNDTYQRVTRFLRGHRPVKYPDVGASGARSIQIFDRKERMILPSEGGANKGS